jgi:hypothetical protein
MMVSREWPQALTSEARRKRGAARSGVFIAILRLLGAWHGRLWHWKAASMRSDRDVANLAMPPSIAFDVLDDVSRCSERTRTRGWRGLETERQYLMDAAKWS